MKLQDIINSRYGLEVGLFVARMLPPGLGFRLAFFLADRIAARKSSPMVRAVRANQWVAGGETLSSAELDEAVRDTFRHTARSQYILYHHLHDVQAMERLINFSPTAVELLELLNAEREGQIVAGLHLSNFDFVAQAGGHVGMKALALAYPQVATGYMRQNRIRRESGLDIVPTNLSTLKLAVQRLRAGGSVITGIDRPVEGVRHRPRFFGRPASLPVHHITLALKAKVPVSVAAAIMRSDGVYDILVSDPIEMLSYDDRKTGLVKNAERVLTVAEGFIRLAPRQWAMFYPAWPEVWEQVPGNV